jgi:cytochrome c6
MKFDLKLILAGAALAAAVTFAFAAPAAENWENHCAKCHGADGKGQTKVGKKLGVLDYTSAADQAKFTDEQAIKVIVEGAKDKAGKERMKGYQDELSPQEIKELVAMVRKFKA